MHARFLSGLEVKLGEEAIPRQKLGGHAGGAERERQELGIVVAHRRPLIQWR